MGLYFRDLGALVQMKVNVNRTACKDILDNYMLPTLRQPFGEGSFQFGKGPLLFQQDCAHSEVHKDMLWVWRNLSGQHKSLTSTTMNLWDELERQL